MRIISVDHVSTELYCLVKVKDPFLCTLLTIELDTNAIITGWWNGKNQSTP